MQASALALNSSILTLDLSGNGPMSHASSDAVAEALVSNSSLTSLNLRDNQIRDKELALIADALHVGNSKPDDSPAACFAALLLCCCYYYSP